MHTKTLSYTITGAQVALRYYRRLLQMGGGSGELWNNLGLCCFYGGQYDMALSCLDRALSCTNEAAAADVWYNIGQVSATCIVVIATSANVY
jgi:tetratricopeptide repeat protein 8